MSSQEPVRPKELIPTFEGELNGELAILADARELHKFLGVQTQFSKWIERKISEYAFVKGEDFYPLVTKSTGGRPTTEYHLSLDMAKEISLVENTPQGRKIRKYFIALEKYMQEMHDLGWLDKFEDFRVDYRRKCKIYVSNELHDLQMRRYRESEAKRAFDTKILVQHQELVTLLRGIQDPGERKKIDAWMAKNNYGIIEMDWKAEVRNVLDEIDKIE